MNENKKAVETEETEETEETTETTETKEETKEEKTVEELLTEKEKEWQAETDRRVNKALDKYKKEQEEINRLAKLSEEERLDELNKIKEKEIKERERQLDIKDSKIHIFETLKDNDLLDASEIFKPENYLGENKEKLTGDIEALKNIVKAEIEKATVGVSKKILTGKSPEATGKEMSKKDFDQMSYSERVNLLNTDPELYRQLSK